MIQLQLSLPPDLFMSVMTAAKIEGLELDDYIRNRLVGEDAVVDTPEPEASPKIQKLAAELYQHAIKRPASAPPVLVEDLYKELHPHTWTLQPVGSRKSLGRVFAKLVDKSYRRGEDVNGRKVRLERRGKTGKNQVIYGTAVL